MQFTAKRSKPELLCPAGSRRSLEAAIEGGADAVYFGAGEFNARMRAENFSGDELSAALRLCRAYSVKSYITLNTRLYTGELADALRLAALLYENGADGLIVADLGIASLIHKAMPDFELHASTQLSGHTVSDALALQSLGFSRMVCPREITKESLFALCKDSPLEIEMFIHGAYCVSFSGQCLMSAVMGGRSGNRGECAQPCRQPYTTPPSGGKKSYPISLKDMCLASQVTDIIASGAASLKIEGRQKPPEYVYGVTKIYRRLLDEGRNATDEESAALRAIFSRDGFSDGYFAGCGAGMRGVRTYDDFLAMDKTPFEGLQKKVPLDMTLRAFDREKATLTVISPAKTVTVQSENVLSGESVSPITKEGAEKNAARLGATPYTLSRFTLECDERAPITLSCLNSLRRSAVSLLSGTERKAPLNITYTPKKPDGKKHAKPLFTAEFLDKKQITPLAREFFDKIYLPCGTDDTEFGVSLPVYLPDGEESEKIWESLSGRHILVHHTGQLFEAVRRGFSPACSLRLNVFNSECAAVLAGAGAASLTLSPELKTGAMRDIDCGGAEKSIIAYGRLPLMTTVRCAISDGGAKCPNKKCGLARGMTEKHTICKSALSDRHGITFPVFGMPDCENIVFNAYPLYTADKPDAPAKTGADSYMFIFTDESAVECDRIINAYKNGTPPDDAAKIRRL